MKPTLFDCAAPIILSLALCGVAEAAPAKSRCFIFCSDSAAQAKEPEAPPVALSAELDTAIGQAQAARKTSDLAGAAKILSQLVLFAPDDPRVLGEYGKTLAAQGKSDDALAFLERAIQLQPNEWSFHSAQGVAYDQKAAYPSAQASYARALSLKPGEPTVLNNAALSHMQSGDLDGAEQLLMQASPGTADYPRIAQNLTLVQNLKAARLASAAPAPASVAAPIVPATAVPPVAEVAPDAAPSITSVQTPPPIVVQATPVKASPLAAPAPGTNVADTVEPSKSWRTLAEMKADPTVLVAAIPEEMPRIAPSLSGSPKTASADTVNPEPPPLKQVASAVPLASSSNTTFYVQAGTYASEDRAGKLAASLDSLGARVSPTTVGGHAMYRVRIGPFLDAKQADAAISLAKSMGQADLRLVS
ncbi:MAG TPA: SPOR domain-containing protein, partial [Burkholderiales bacterium]|nr:SPOR domain-containing protein [Burkholderiales bacterium]